MGSNRLDSRVIVITGGLGDIGLATARVLSAEGATIAAIDVVRPTDDNPDAVFGPEVGIASLYLADVCDRDAVDRALTDVVQRFGRLDVLIANAGIVANQSFLSIDADKWERTLKVNLTGAFNCAQAAARWMVRQSPLTNGLRGKILFTGSWVQEMPWPEGAAYIASKAGVRMLAKVIAQELAEHAITANVIAPGIVMAGLSKAIHDSDEVFRDRVSRAIPLRQMQTVESVAAAFLFMCSDDSNYMTGASLLVDGGASLVRRDQ